MLPRTLHPQHSTRFEIEFKVKTVGSTEPKKETRHDVKQKMKNRVLEAGLTLTVRQQSCGNWVFEVREKVVGGKLYHLKR